MESGERTAAMISLHVETECSEVDDLFCILQNNFIYNFRYYYIFGTVNYDAYLRQYLTRLMLLDHPIFPLATLSIFYLFIEIISSY